MLAVAGTAPAAVDPAAYACAQAEVWRELCDLLSNPTPTP